MAKRVYSKPPLSFSDQLQVLIDRKLTINDKTKATKYLSQINYYRLSAYFLPFQSAKDEFEKGTTFSSIIDTYSFDRLYRAY